MGQETGHAGGRLTLIEGLKRRPGLHCAMPPAPPPPQLKKDEQVTSQGFAKSPLRELQNMEGGMGQDRLLADVSGMTRAETADNTNPSITAEEIILNELIVSAQSKNL